MQWLEQISKQKGQWAWQIEHTPKIVGVAEYLKVVEAILLNGKPIAVDLDEIYFSTNGQMTPPPANLYLG